MVFPNPKFSNGKIASQKWSKFSTYGTLVIRIKKRDAWFPKHPNSNTEKL